MIGLLNFIKKWKKFIHSINQSKKDNKYDYWVFLKNIGDSMHKSFEVGLLFNKC
jgi:hypothetical protein